VQTTETLDSAGLENALRHPVAGSLKNIYDMGDIFVIEMEHTSREDMWALKRQLSARKDIIFASPLFGGMPPTVYTNKVYARIKSKDDYPVLQKYAEAYHIEDIRIEEYMGPQTYTLTLPHNPEKDAIQTALELYETGLFQYVEPDCLILCAFEWCPFGPESGPDMNEDIPEDQAIVIYPNPVNDIIYIDLEKDTRAKPSASYDIRLYNSLGNLSRQAKAPGGIVELGVSDLTAGIYFLHICAGSASKPDVHKNIVKH
jgi:hypothetical protein